MRKKKTENAFMEQPEANKVYLGNALSILKSWPDNFIDCCVSSPPYYGLRNYNTPPQVWDGDEICGHVWGDAIPNKSVDLRDPELKTSQGATVGNNKKTALSSIALTHGQYCQKCNKPKIELGNLHCDHRWVLVSKPETFSDQITSAPIVNQPGESAARFDIEHYRKTTTLGIKGCLETFGSEKQSQSIGEGIKSAKKNRRAVKSVADKPALSTNKRADGIGPVDELPSRSINGNPANLASDITSCFTANHRTGSPLPDATGPDSEGLLASFADKSHSHIVMICEKCEAVQSQCVLEPAWLGELGQEPHFNDYIRHMIQIYTEIYRCLKPTGTCWVNLGDSYNGFGKGVAGTTSQIGNVVTNGQHLDRLSACSGIQKKSLMNIPYRFAIAMTDEVGFAQRNEIIWHKPSCMPSSAKDRFTIDFEPIFFFTKTGKYYFEQQFESQQNRGVRDRSENKYHKAGLYSEKGLTVRLNPEGRNMRTTWSVNFEPSSEEHYAAYPTRLLDIPIKSGCPEKVCVKCGEPYRIQFEVVGKTVTKAMRIAGGDVNGEYHGQATKDFDGNNVQNASDVKRRILEAMSQVKERREVKSCTCDTHETTQGIVFDPFTGTGSTCIAVIKLGRQYLGCELQPEYHKILTDRLALEEQKGRLF